MPDVGLARDVLSTIPSVRAQRDMFFVKELRPMRRRLGAIALVHNAAMFALYALGGLSVARVGGLIALLFGGIAFQTVWPRWITPTGRIELSYFGSTLVGQTFTSAFLVLTGGLQSPTVPVLAMNLVVTVLLCSGHRYAVYLSLTLVAHVVAVALVPTSITGAPMTTWHHDAIFVIALVWGIIVGGLIGRRLSGAAQDAGLAVEALRQERISEAEAHGKRLQAVSARVAHELKNPLAAIKGLVQLVARGTTEPKAQERLEVVQGEIERMAVILREYLSFARPLEELAPVSIDLADVVRDMAAVVGGRAETGRIRLELRARPAQLVADPRRLKEALLNVLSNAVDATPAGGCVAIESRPGEGGQGGVIEVRDSGRGIKPEHLPKIGTTYFTTRAEGTGLGVALVVGVVHQHGGRIRYASRPGHGTTVTISLPATPTTVPPGTVVLSVEPTAPEAP